MEFLELISDFFISIFTGREKDKRTDTGSSDGFCPVCGVEVFLTDKEFKQGYFTCRNCGNEIEKNHLRAPRP
jgi:transcription elongation factor Elf1